MSQNQELASNQGVASVPTRVFFGLVVVGTLLLVVRPLLAPTILAVLAAVVGAPLHRRAEGLLGEATHRAAFLSLMLFSVFLGGPFVGLALLLLAQAREVLVEFLGMPEGMTLGSRILQLTEQYLIWLRDMGSRYLGTTVDLEAIASERLQQLAAILYGALPGVLEGLGRLTFALLVFSVVLFFLLRDGPRIVDLIRDLSPLGRGLTLQLLLRMQRTLQAVVLGGLLTAVFQSLVGATGFWLAGFPNFAIWGALLFVASFVPVFGTALVWLPAAVYLLANGQHSGAGLLVALGLVISTTDNLLRFVLIGRRVALHPLLVFFGVFGGLAGAGPMGLIYGLLLVATLTEAVQMYRERSVGPSIAPPADSREDPLGGAESRQ